LTVPVGVPAPLVTVAVNVTDWPNADGLSEAPTTVVVGELGTVTVTESEHVLLLSLVSGMTFCGSTAQLPPARGFANVPPAVGVAENFTPKLAPGARVTVPLLAVHVRLSLPSIPQLIVPLPEMPVGFTTLGDP
jgi:hypothetical protein